MLLVVSLEAFAQMTQINDLLIFYEFILLVFQFQELDSWFHLFNRITWKSARDKQSKIVLDRRMKNRQKVTETYFITSMVCLIENCLKMLI